MSIWGGIGAAVGGVGGALLGGPAGAAVGASIGGALGGGLDSSNAQKEANKTNIKLSDKQMAFQERMSSSAHQRQVADMKSAGLNPMLSANLGGASAPSGSLAQVQNPDIHKQQAMQQAVESALKIKALNQDLKNQKAQEQKTKTETTLLKANEPAAQIKNDLGKAVQRVVQNVTSSAKSTKKKYIKIEKQPKNYNPKSQGNKSGIPWINNLLH